ncbi:APC family permease [Streptomyces torulosus]|uniref:APC family permease n=1 Tax=Streptomyces torulosus TaxID=68276 RepID=UPI0006EB8F63|nr:APC family permease [Streptomyces torulosus]
MTSPDRITLAHGRLSLIGVLTQSIGFMGPVFSVAALLPLVVGLSATGRGAGVATPVAIAIAGVGMCGVGWVIAQYAKRIHLCGSLYEYVSDSAGPRVGVAAGWLYYGAMMVLGASTFLVLGGLTRTWLLNALSVDVPWWPLSLAYAALVVGVLVIGVQVSIRAQLVLALATILVVLVFSLVILFRAGRSGGGLPAEPFDPFSVGRLDLLYGVLYGINMFIGFESAANLAEETANPKRHVPRAVLWSLTLVGVYYLVVAYAQAVGFGLDAQAWKDSVFPLEALASGKEYGSSGFGTFMGVLIILDVLAVAIGVGVASSRGMLSMARSGRLPAKLAHLHPRFLTPVWGAALWGALSCLVIVAVRVGDGVFSRETAQPGVLQPQWSPAFSWMAGFGGTGLALMYLIVAALGVKGLWPHVGHAKLLVAGSVGVLVSAGAVFGAVYQAQSPLDTVPWALLGWVVLGVAWSLFVHRRAPRPEATVDEPARSAGEVTTP